MVNMGDVSDRKRTNMKYGLIIGAIVGVALFLFCYMTAHSLMYLFFIPIAALMGWGVQYTKDEQEED